MLGGFQFTPSRPKTGSTGQRPASFLGTPIPATPVLARAKPIPAFVAATLAPLLAAVFLVGPLAAGPVAAESPSPKDARPRTEAGAADQPGGTRATAAHARVSMSPEEDAAAVSPAPPASARAGESTHATPLTRAAARRRVETISPVPWLARFGPVSLERRE